MLKRKIEKTILKWIENDNKALLVYGARQVGKTYIIRKCLKQAEADYVELNLIEQPEVVPLLENASSIDDMILKLSLYSDKPLVPGKTIIFLDEIQKAKEIITKIKFLVEDQRFRYILSGSLLGVEITNLTSAPVGYLKSITMYPLNFEEFLQVFNVSNTILEQVKISFEKKVPVDEVIHKKLTEIFNLYLIIGGMPAAVEKYRLTGNIDEVISEHQEIIHFYQLDFTQYEEENRKLLLRRIYDMIPAELNQCNKRFKVSDVKKNLRYDRVEESFTWLWKAGVALPVFNTTEPTIPLLLNERYSLFKLFLSDVGLLTTMYGKACKLKIVQQDKGINKGAIFEDVVAQELIAHDYKVYYYNNKKTGEIDFIVEHNGKALPIEVKSGKDYERHSALDTVLKNKDFGIEEAIVFNYDNVKVDEKITYYPLYMTMFLQNNHVDFVNISPSKFQF